MAYPDLYRVYLVVCLILGIFTWSAHAQDDPLANFGDTIQVLGQMARTDQDFKDGLALDLFSPTNRTLVVTNNTSPLPGNFVKGSSGEGFTSLSTYSWIVKMNETAQDLIAKIELPYDPVALQKEGFDVSNTFVGKLAPDGKAWVISENQRNVHVSENKTRIIKLTSLDGEYMLLGRKSVDNSNIFVQYGQGATRTVNVTGGAGIQEAEFVDGLRFSVAAAAPFALNVDIPNGVDQAALPENTMPLNSFSWVINTTATSSSGLSATVSFPFNTDMLAAKAPDRKPQQLIVARRALNATSTDRFSALEKQRLSWSANTISAEGLPQLDGQYVLVIMGNGLGDDEEKND
ncbi:hypothetical protein N8I77_002578 [Diaporthe amygdali]|uniref:Uncharacterized protein n=1 Tax=Phomopsis amygdali TaxID=1214568 RepID=A0AAD9SU38_PHOAM|nr:hypothetical protein N8I77_002578 [Diaporthe amygdali]